MGRCYAKSRGFSDDIADACQEHYLPQGPLDEVPRKPVSITVALAEKVDMVCSFWAINQKPTGSKDPFALRRASIGIIRILLENQLDITLVKLLNLGNNDLEFDDLINFFFDRIRAHLIEKGIAFDVLNSVISKDYENISLKDMLSRAQAIQTFVTTMSGKDLIQGYKRAVNILNVEENRDGVIYSLEPKYDLMELPSEINLYEKLVQIDEKVIQDLKETKIEGALENLSHLRIPIDKFFNEVKINSENAIIRRNRLCLLNQIKEVMHRVAHFSKVDGEQ
jgi:glycyl-tRNA synthetase beta chain